jgi:hypothetical protein
MRQFDTGASRDTEEGKFDYEAFLSPLVIRAFGDYMHKHRVQSDGSIRDGANWQKGFGENHLSVCMSSLWRHFLDLWSLHRGWSARDTIDDAICGILFNVMAYYHRLLEQREKNEGNVLQK